MHGTRDRCGAWECDGAAGEDERRDDEERIVAGAINEDAEQPGQRGGSTRREGKQAEETAPAARGVRSAARAQFALAKRPDPMLMILPPIRIIVTVLAGTNSNAPRAERSAPPHRTGNRPMWSLSTPALIATRAVSAVKAVKRTLVVPAALARCRRSRM